MFYQIKDVVNFEENSFYIIKTNEYKNWHPAMANIDLDTIIEEFFQRMEAIAKWQVVLKIKN